MNYFPRNVEKQLISNYLLGDRRPVGEVKLSSYFGNSTYFHYKVLPNNTLKWGTGLFHKDGPIYWGDDFTGNDADAYFPADEQYRIGTSGSIYCEHLVFAVFVIIAFAEDHM